MDEPPEATSPPAEYTEVLQAYYLATFIPVNWGIQDQISRSIVDFQFGREPEATQWIRLALGAASTLAPVNLIVRALSSREMTPTTTSSLDQLCSDLAGRLACLYEPARITKRRPVRAVKNGGTREEREKLLHGAFEFEAGGIPDSATILIVDDIITTGATLAALADAIREKLPDASLKYFALARTDPFLVEHHLGLRFPEELDGHRGLARHGVPHEERPAGEGSYTPDRRKPADTTQRTPVRQPSTKRPGTVLPVREFGDDDASPAPTRAPAAAAPGKPLPRPSSPLAEMLLSPSFLKPVILGAIALAVLFVSFLLVQGPNTTRGTSELPPAPEVYTADPVQPQKGAPAEKPVQPPPPKVDRRPRGVINVPTVGLRTEPLITSPSVEGIFVQSGDRVTVVRRLNPETGPEWYLIETSAGRRGWVIAAVVTLRQPGITSP